MLNGACGGMRWEIEYEKHKREKIKINKQTRNITKIKTKINHNSIRLLSIKKITSYIKKECDVYCANCETKQGDTDTMSITDTRLSYLVQPRLHGQRQWLPSLKVFIKKPSE